MTTVQAPFQFISATSPFNKLATDAKLCVAENAKNAARDRFLDLSPAATNFRIIS
jgi:hypothetical protein